ncbi:AraC family transcriptional regulator [Coraliomargarita sp. W4R53]
MKATLEAIPQTMSESFAYRVFDQKCFTTPWHYHPELEITLIESSVGELFVGDGIRSFRGGDLYIFGPNLPHYFHNSEMNNKLSSRALVIQFRPEIFGNKFWELIEMTSIRKLMQQANLGIRVDGACLETAKVQIREMSQLNGAARLLKLFHLLEGISHEQLNLETLSSEGFMPVLDLEANRRMTKVYQYIFSEFRSEITLGGAAQAAGMTQSAFCRYFRKVTGKQFTAFINELRISRSCRELIDSTRNIAEIAYDCGYGSLSNYNRCFKLITGVSPRAFRVRHTKAMAENNYQKIPE